MNNRLAGIVIATSAVVAAARHGFCAAPAGWPEQLGRVASSTVRMTDTNLAQLLKPAIVLAPAPCSTARLPSPASAAPVSGAIIAYQDDKACNAPTTLLLLQVSLTANPGDLQRLKQALARALPAPCFAGNLPQDPRRHAPIRSLVAWRLPERVVTLAMEAGDDADAALSLLGSADLQSGQAGPSAEMIKSFVDGLPPSCR